MKVRFIKAATPAGYGYTANEVADLPVEAAKRLIDTGYAEAIERKEETVETRESKATPEARGRKKR